MTEERVFSQFILAMAALSPRSDGSPTKRKHREEKDRFEKIEKQERAPAKGEKGEPKVVLSASTPIPRSQPLLHPQQRSNNLKRQKSSQKEAELPNEKPIVTLRTVRAKGSSRFEPYPAPPTHYSARVSGTTL